MQMEQQQSTAATEAKSRQADDEAFNSVRQAALLMFKQRTKDLTRLANVEAQSQQIEAELQQAQTSMAQLSVQQASLEALVEEEQQRIRQREGGLAELHGALVQVDEEQRTYKKLQQSAGAAVDAATTFIAQCTSPSGRLFHLLAAAKELIAGRTSRDLQAVLAVVQQKLTEAAEQRQRLRSRPGCVTATEGLPQEDVVAGCVAVLRGWATQVEVWSRHRDLADTLGTLRQVLQWATEHQSADQTTAASSIPMADEQTDVSADVLQWPALPPCPSNDLMEKEDAFFCVPEAEVVKWVEVHVRVPIRVLRVCRDHLSTMCAEDHLNFPEEVASRLTSLETTADADWTALLTRRQELEAEVVNTVAATELASAAAHAQQAAQAEAQALRESNAHLHTVFSERQSELETKKEVELANYAAAWRKGWSTLAAQRVSMLAMQHAVSTRTNDATQTAALMASEAAAHAEEVRGSDASAQAQQAHLSTAQEQLAAASAQKSALEKELAAAQQMEREAQDQLEELLSSYARRAISAETAGAAVYPESCAEPDTLMEVIEHGPPSATAALQAVSACPGVYKEWAAKVDAQRERLDSTESTTTLLEALCHATEAGEHEQHQSAKSIVAALQQVASALQLPEELFQSDVVDEELLRQLSCLTTLTAVEKSRRASADAHRVFMAEVEAETKLLRQELTSEE